MGDTVQNGKGSKRRICDENKIAENWDAIDWRVKKTSIDWCKHFCVTIINPSGWPNHPDALLEKITDEEFLRRVSISTVMFDAEHNE